MAKNNRFLVSYIVDNDPRTSEVASDQESLTPGDALQLLTAMDRSLNADHLTNVQVQKLVNNAHEPGHNLQHGDL